MMINNIRFSIKLAIIVCIMFGFSYALVPFYNIACNILGINSVNEMSPVQLTKTEKIINDREINMQFDVTINNNISIQVTPELSSMKINPGVQIRTFFVARNESDHAMTINAIPSILPIAARDYINKIECFCFEQQTLKVGEEAKMPLLFYIDTAIPDNIDLVTLSYTFFEAI